MKQALIVGGTKGFGEKIVKGLHQLGMRTISVGRSEGSCADVHYACDVGEGEQWKETLKRIRKDCNGFDLILFLVGYARAKPSSLLTHEDWNIHHRLNVEYVQEGVEELGQLLKASLYAMLVTIGSQWSYRRDNDLLQPYIDAKHKLQEMTEAYAAANPEVSSIHYCVPAMDTPQRELVWADFGTKPDTEASKPSTIAHAITDHLKGKPRSGTYIVNTDGKIFTLTN